jgi:predicted short-subunit dehydrogenase-like oxidoreductase (DUF2520 family)
MDIIFIGAGNVATNLAKAFSKAGHTIIQVVSKNASSASALARNFQCPFTTQLKETSLTADIYLVCVNDAAIEQAIVGMPVVNGLVAHTSGSTHIDVFQNKFLNFGVLYPLQSFSKFREPDLSSTPFFIEGNLYQAVKTLSELASGISPKIQVIDSAQRMALHVCGIFASNFSNHMYALAYELSKNYNLPFEVFFPLIHETAEKIKHRAPKTAQTGPAVRRDQNILDKHEQFLSAYPELLEIYKAVSNSIDKFSR